MYDVSLAKECGCIKKDTALRLPKNYETRVEAELGAFRIANKMNKEYCKKHRFHVDEVENEFVIDFDYSCKDGGQ
ncbi:MAG TPA: hypothetical protein PLV58_05605 [Campylobacterales bacterium]|nr:hypothetical protein [Campylobacterales bacterium]